MAEEKKFKTMEEIEARLALYKKHVQTIPASKAKDIAQKIMDHWDQLATVMVPHPVGEALRTLHYTQERSPDQPDPKGENFIKYTVSHQYRIKEKDFEFLMECCLGYGYYDNTPTYQTFRITYVHSDEHQFGIMTHPNRESGKITELNMRSVDHSEQELQALGAQLAQLLTP